MIPDGAAGCTRLIASEHGRRIQRDRCEQISKNASRDRYKESIKKICLNSKLGTRNCSNK